MKRALAALLVLTACADSHVTDDAGASDAAATHDGFVTHVDPSLDLGPAHDAGAPLVDSAVPCGPNVCRAGEICCNATCGICAFPAECVDYGCGGWHSP